MFIYILKVVAFLSTRLDVDKIETILIFLFLSHQTSNYIEMTAIVCKPLDFNKHCAFCAGSGIEGPHDHWLRSSRRPDAKITCPQLLEHKCEHCGRKGHTKKHCGELNWERSMRRQEAAELTKKLWHDGGWTTSYGRMRNTHVDEASINKQVTVAKTTSRFGALDLDSVEDEDTPASVKQEVAEEIQQVKADSMSWADAVRGTKIAEAVACAFEAQGVAVEPSSVSVMWKKVAARTQRVSNWADSDEEMEY